MNRKLAVTIGCIALLLTVTVATAAIFDYENNYEAGIRAASLEYDYDNNMYYTYNGTSDTFKFYNENWNLQSTQTITAAQTAGSLPGIDYYNGSVYIILDNNNNDNATVGEYSTTGQAFTRIDTHYLAPGQGGFHQSYSIEYTKDYIFLGGYDISPDQPKIQVFENNDDTVNTNLISQHVLSIDGGLGVPSVRGIAQTDNKIYVMAASGEIAETNLSNINFNHNYTLTSSIFNNPSDPNYVSLTHNYDSGSYWAGAVDTVNGSGTLNEGVFEFEGSVPNMFRQQYTVSGKVQNIDNIGIAGATVSNNGTAPDTQTNSAGNYNISLVNGTYQLNATKQDFNRDTAIITVNGSDVTQHFTLLKNGSQFQLQANPYMEHGSTQSYKIVYTRNLGNGQLHAADLTNQANISSNNTSVVTVDTSANELIATTNEDINNQVNITANYTDQNGKFWEDTVQITVANQTMENIDIMPPSQYVNTFLGVGESGTVYGLGSEIQWILLAVIFGAVIGAVGDNEWIGLAGITIFIIIFWLIGPISLGILMISVLFAIAIGLVLIDVPSRTNVDVHLDRSTNDFDEFDDF